MKEKPMFARVSTFNTGPETVSGELPQEIVERVLQMPGCQGIYYLAGKDTDKALSITLWDTEEAMAESRQAANKLREEASEAEKTQIAAVEEFKVTVSSLKG